MGFMRNMSWSWLGLLLSLPASAADLPWEQIYEADGVVVERAEVEDSKLFAFKGTKTMAGSPQNVLGVLLDNEHRVEWVDRLALNYIIEQNNPYDYVLYQNFELPALFADRDYVYHGRVVESEGTGVLTLTMQSVEHDRAPETTGVRAQLINSRYVITPVDASHTKVEVEIITDPMGMMPSWLVNIIQKDWPYETLTALEGEFAKPYHKPYPLPSEARKAEEEAAAKAAAEAAAVEGGTEEGSEAAGGGDVETAPAPGE